MSRTNLPQNSLPPLEDLIKRVYESEKSTSQQASPESVSSEQKPIFQSQTFSEVLPSWAYDMIKIIKDELSERDLLYRRLVEKKIYSDDLDGKARFFADINKGHLAVDNQKGYLDKNFAQLTGITKQLMIADAYQHIHLKKEEKSNFLTAGIYAIILGAGLAYISWLVPIPSQQKLENEYNLHQTEVSKYVRRYNKYPSWGKSPRELDKEVKESYSSIGRIFALASGLSILLGAASIAVSYSKKP